jgi:Arc/MetJ-type ribon-helix-helix transcriptional regulator
MPKGVSKKSVRDPPVDSRTHIVSFHIPRALLDALDQLVEMGVFNNRSEAIRTALFNLLREHRDLAERRQMILGYR